MDQPRRTARVPLNCEIEFRRHAGSRYPVDLLDLSPNGCCISPPVRVEPGESVWLRIPGMETIHAKVAWSEQWKVGLEFDNPFHPAVFDSVVKKLRGPTAS
ncbi:MAG TPA: PilZ domain-containing protein [Sphingomicrobium sp.]|nr:PilZ domain-containing protein [Sphingomicrobium sp.]